MSVLAGGLGAMTALAQPPHPVATAAASVRAELSEVATAAIWSMDAAQTAQTLDDVEAAEAQLRALKSRLLVHAETVDLPAQAGAASTANWLAHHNTLTHREAHRQTRLAKALDAHDLTRQALAEGRVNLEQAEAILRGLDTLPEDLDADLTVRAEEHLLELAKDHDAKALKHLARTILEVVAPDIADQHLARQLEREERDAAAAARFSMWEDGHGKVHGRFTLDALTGAMLKKHLHALAAPKHRASQGPSANADPHPSASGRLSWSWSSATPPTTSRTPAASTPPSWSSCTSRPSSVGSEVLDLGRSRRFHSKAQRIKATIEQGGCLEEGCDAPPAMTQMHHPQEFAKGGETNRDGWMLCPSAHRRAHDPRYTHQRLPNGKLRFTRRE